MFIYKSFKSNIVNLTFSDLKILMIQLIFARWFSRFYFHFPRINEYFHNWYTNKN